MGSWLFQCPLCLVLQRGAYGGSKAPDPARTPLWALMSSRDVVDIAGSDGESHLSSHGQAAFGGRFKRDELTSVSSLR